MGTNWNIISNYDWNVDLWLIIEIYKNDYGKKKFYGITKLLIGFNE